MLEEITLKDGGRYYHLRKLRDSIWCNKEGGQ